MASRTYNFYSHALVGRDEMGDSAALAADSISTHTPSWGVTLSTADSAPRRYFYSHALVGRDKSDEKQREISALFLLTRPRGA